MQYVKAVLIDARDGYPVTQYPLRNGPQIPYESKLEIEWVDRNQRPSYYYGTLPDSVKISGQGVEKLTKTQYNKEKEKFIEKEKNKLFDIVRKNRKAVDDSGTTFTYNDKTLFTKTDRLTRDDVKDVIDQIVNTSVSEVTWEHRPHEWTTLDKSKAEKLLEVIRDHRSKAFQRQYDLESKIENISSITDLKSVEREVDSGWPDNS